VSSKDRVIPMCGERCGLLKASAPASAWDCRHCVGKSPLVPGHHSGKSSHVASRQVKASVAFGRPRFPCLPERAGQKST
jgi:hypothetical protein